MSPEEIPISDITREKNLLQVWLDVCQHIPDSRLSMGALLVFAIVLGAYAAGAIALGHIPHSVLADQTRSIVDVGLSFSTQILGFILAGFTIFATVGNTKLFVHMARARRPEPEKVKLSYLKFNFGTFMKVFIVYLTYMVLCLLMKIFCMKSGLIPLLSIALSGGNELFLQFIAAFGLWIIGIFTFYLAVSLQSFIFNVYHAVMTNVEYLGSGLE